MPASKQPARKLFTRATLIPLGLFSIGLVLWLGAASVVTYRILHPPFLNGRGDVIIASETAHTGVPAGDPKTCCDAPFENLRVTDADGISVDAWFVPGTLPPAVLLIPASGGSRAAMLPYLKLLHSAGLPVLMIDNSDFPRRRAGWGWGERGIARSAADLLRKRGFTNVAALGVSEGAATALMVQADDPTLFKAIIADSSFANLEAMLRRSPSLAGLNPAFLRTVMWELGWKLGRSAQDISPAAAASRIGNCALLVVQNPKDPLTPEGDGRAILGANPESKSRAIFLSSSSGHGDAIYVDPDAYRKALLDFLARNLPGAESIAPH